MTQAATHAKDKRTALIIGAGPAGLTAALELLRHTDIHPVILEASRQVGGLSRTVEHNGNRIDIGGHRFFSKDPAVMKWWTDLLPIQGKPAADDLPGPHAKAFPADGPDPEREDRVMLLRHRLSHILYNRKFFTYPVTFNMETLLNLGLFRSAYAGAGWMYANMFKRAETSLEEITATTTASGWGWNISATKETPYGGFPTRISSRWHSKNCGGPAFRAAWRTWRTPPSSGSGKPIPPTMAAMQNCRK